MEDVLLEYEVTNKKARRIEVKKIETNKYKEAIAKHKANIKKAKLEIKRSKLLIKQVKIARKLEG